MAEGFYCGLRKLYPAAHITLDSRLPADELPFKYWDDSVIAKAVTGHFDLAITLVSSSRAAMELFARAPVRVGYGEFLARFLLTDSIPWPDRSSGLHKSLIYDNLLAWIGGKPERPRLLPHLGCSKRLVLAPQASITLREWPYFTNLLEKVKADWDVVVVGTDITWSKRLRRTGIRFDDLIGKTSLAELVTILESAALCVANDSGVAHLAGRVNCPTVVLMGPGDPHYVAPRGDVVKVVRDSDLSCSPCESRHCRAPFGYQRCLRNVSVTEVMNAIETLRCV